MKPPKFVLEDMDSSMFGDTILPDFLNSSDSFASGDFRQQKLTHISRRKAMEKKKLKKSVKKDLTKS